MPSIRIWALESDNDAKAVKCLAEKLLAHWQLENLSVHTSGRSAVPKPRQKSVATSSTLKLAVENYLKQDAGVIFVIDNDGPMSDHQRRQEPNSLINQVTRIIEDKRFSGKVFLAQAVQEFEAWLLIDCIGIFRYFAGRVSQYRNIVRDAVLENPSFTRLVNRYQKGNTEYIVEAETQGKGAKEFLKDYSRKILFEVNQNMPPRNIRRHEYRESLSPEVAENVLVDQHTLRRNNSLRELGNCLARIHEYTDDVYL